jgi:hypothetical protein
MLHHARGLGAWGVLAGVGDLADTSWRERLRKASKWLAWIVSQQVQTPSSQPGAWLKKAGYESIELVDATHLKCVGLHGKTWRIHCMYSLLTQQIRQVVISSAKAGESLKHFALRAKCIYVHDSGYGYREQVAHSINAGAYMVGAVYPATFPLETEEGKCLDVTNWLKQQKARAGKICSISSYFVHQEKRYEIRFIALRRTKEQTAEMLRRKRRKAIRRKGPQKTLQPENIYMAGWLLVMTTLPALDWSAKDVLTLYRARWHIELLFKRIKQLLDQHCLRAETEETAKATIYAILASWLLQQHVANAMKTALKSMYQIIEQERDAMSEGSDQREGHEETAISEWQVQVLSVEVFRQQVRGSWSQQRLTRCLPQLERHLRIRSRKRPHRWQQVCTWLTDSGGNAGQEQRSTGNPDPHTVPAATAVLA